MRRKLRLLMLLMLVAVTSACMGSHNRPLQLLSGAGPTYPAAARANGVEGEVVVRYGVSVEGQVVNARIESAQPPGVFDQAALATVRSWKYNPQLRDGQPVAVDNILSTIRFRLGNSDRYDDY